jgi:hypothetical protein
MQPKQICQFILLLVFGLYANNAWSQASLEVNVEQAGKLRKQIKKNQYQIITDLTITGRLNNADVLVLSNLTNLQTLSFKDVRWENDDQKKAKQVFLFPVEARSGFRTTRIKLPTLPKLETIKTSGCYDMFVDVENIPNLKKVYMTNGQTRFVGSKSKLEEITLSIDWLDTGGNLYIPTDTRLQATVLRLVEGSIGLTQDLLNGIIMAGRPKELDDVFDYNFLIVGDCIVLNNWDEGLSPELVNNAAVIAPFAYKEYSKESLVVPPAVSYISQCAFNNPLIKKIDLANVAFIEKKAFEGCTELTELSAPALKAIDSEAFAGSSLKHLTLPASLEKFVGDAFANSSLEDVEFTGQYPPEIIEYSKPYSSVNVSGYTNCSDLAFDGVIYVPEGRFDAYNIGSYKKASVMEKGKGREYVFNVDKPGTLNRYITDANAGDIVSLTITGRLYDTDFDAIYKCKNLRSLDLSHCFIMESYATAKQKREEDAALLELLSAVASMANANESVKFRAGLGNVSDVAYTEAASKLFGKALKELESGEITPSDQCVFPDRPFNDDPNRFLTKIVLPIQMKKVPALWQAHNLKEIILPPYAEEIPYRSFQSAKISSISFPATLKKLGEESFIGADLTEVDLSHTQVERLSSTFESCNNLKIFKGNRKLTYIYGPIGTKNVVGYFYTLEKPEGLQYDTFKTIHIPRGSKAGWPKRDYDEVEIIDDIEL